jgi:hypothetical protein
MGAITHEYHVIGRNNSGNLYVGLGSTLNTRASFCYFENLATYHSPDQRWGRSGSRTGFEDSSADCTTPLRYRPQIVRSLALGTTLVGLFQSLSNVPVSTAD